MTSATTLAPPSLFNLHTGKITLAFQRQLDICDISLEKHVCGFAPDHIINVNRVLQDKCFQKGCDFYKKGNINPKLNLSYERAATFLEDEYRNRPEILPTLIGTCDAIVESGMETTMHKRFDSLKKALNFGCKFETIHFITKNETDIYLIEEMIKESYGEIIKGSKINFVETNTESNILENGLHSLSKQNTIDFGYVLVTDIPFASKIEGIARPILKGKVCYGVAATSIKDWQVDMNHHGCAKAHGSKEKAAIAWASSALNFKAEQVQSELAVYEANERISKNRTGAAIVFGVVGSALLISFLFKKFQ